MRSQKSFELVRQQTKSVALTCFSIARLNGQFYRTYHSLCPSQSLSPVLCLSDRFTDPTPSLRADEWVREKCDPSRSRSHPRSAARRSAPGCIDASLIHVRRTLTIVDRHVFLEQIAKFDEQREENKVSLFFPGALCGPPSSSVTDSRCSIPPWRSSRMYSCVLTCSSRPSSPRRSKSGQSVSERF